MPPRRQRTLYPGDAILQRIQASTGQALDELARVDFLSGRLLSGVDFVSATAKQVRHHLGYKPRGAWLVNPYEPGVSPTALSGGDIARRSIRDPRRSQESYATSVGLSHTLSFTPADGRTLLLAFASSKGSPFTAINSITSTGATWVKIADVNSATPGSLELWWAYNVSGAGTALTFNLSNTAASAAYVGVLELREINSGTLVGSTTQSFSASDETVLITGVPTAAIGNVGVVAYYLDANNRVAPTNGWDLQLAQERSSADFFGIFSKVAEYAEVLSFHTAGVTASTDSIFIQAVLPAACYQSISASVADVPAIAVTASDRDTITLYPTRTFTGDVWVY